MWVTGGARGEVLGVHTPRMRTMSRPTPTHRRLTQENLRALEDPTSAQYTLRRWRHTRAKLLRTFVSFALIVAGVQMCTMAGRSDQSKEAPAADSARAARAPAT
jgi:hypothetical protein